MRKFLTIFTLSLLAVSCIDNDYDLSDIDTDDIGIGDENSVFTCPLMTLRVAVADIVNEQGDLDGILAEADVWLPSRLPDGAEAVDVKRLTGGDGQQAQQAYVQTLLTVLQEEIDADASDRKLEQIARQIYAEYREDFLPDYLPVDVDEAEYIAAFRTVYHQQATHDLIWENIELFAARYLTTNLRIDVRPFVLSGIDVGADVRDMIVALRRYCDRPAGLLLGRTVVRGRGGGQRPHVVQLSFLYRLPDGGGARRNRGDVRLCGCTDGHLRPGDPHRTEHAAGKLLSRAFARSRTGNYHQPESSQEGRFNL